MSSTTHLKQDEFDLKDGGNGPLKTQSIVNRTAHGEIESSPVGTQRVLWHGRNSVQ